MSIPKNADENFQSFYAWAKEHLAKHGKRLIEKNTVKVICPDDNTKCSGWCDGDEIVIAKKNPRFRRVFVHEFCHILQAIENTDVWRADTSSLWHALEQRTISIKNWKQIQDAIAVEHDCEKRALKISEKWGLFDNADYAKHANVYLYFYQYVFLTNSWHNSTTIYHKKILEAMPDKLVPLKKLLHTIDMDMMSLYATCLNPKGK